MKYLTSLKNIKYLSPEEILLVDRDILNERISYLISTAVSYTHLDVYKRQVKEAVLRVTGHKYRLGLYSGGEKKAPKKKADPLDDLLGRLKNAQVETEIR